jgi:pentatricopeptide repeat protein
MSLIRAAGRDRDVDRAFAVLDKLKESGVVADNAAYNCVLDACVLSGEMKRARGLLEDMKLNHCVDIITYNTILKGLCSLGDLKGAKELFQEMNLVGLQPNDVSFNCLINAAVSRGNFKDAWHTIDKMEKQGVPVDNYTVSIMMKALKKVSDARDVGKALSLLDRSGLDVCGDEVLLNTVLETCIRHKKVDRISRIITDFSRSGICASVHTYGSMIKACSTLRRVDQCKELWYTMTEQRGMAPNDIVLGCILDALVCNDCVDEAVQLFKHWKTKVPPNTVMYSTLIKGFATDHRAGQALQFWEEMHASNLSMNTVVYNALIDSQARVGAIDAVLRLLSGMERDGCKPDAITYSTIVKAYCIKGDLDKALQVFRDMHARYGQRLHRVQHHARWLHPSQPHGYR